MLPEAAVKFWFDEYIVSIKHKHALFYEPNLVLFPSSYSFTFTFKPYVKANIFPLIYRDATDPEVIQAGLNGHSTPISHFTQMVHANTEKVNIQL